MNDTQTHRLSRMATTVFALAFAFGVNAVAVYAMGGSGTPNGHAQPALVADLGTLPTINVRGCRISS